MTQDTEGRPERLPLPGGWYFALAATFESQKLWVIRDGRGHDHGAPLWDDKAARAFASALQPQPRGVTSDAIEAAARAICRKQIARNIRADGFGAFDEARIARAVDAGWLDFTDFAEAALLSVPAPTDSPPREQE